MGGVISPLLANVYLHRLDREWETRGHGVLCRYADDLVVACKTRSEAGRALAALHRMLAELGLHLRRDKTRIVHLREGGEGFDFLGFEHRYVRAQAPKFRRITFLARTPSRETMQRCRDRVRELTSRERFRLPVERVVNAYLRAWASYFRYGNSARRFDQISRYALMRLALFVAKRRERPRPHGFAVVYASPNQLGLIRLSGNVVPLRPNQGWRDKPNATR